MSPTRPLWRRLLLDDEGRLRVALRLVGHALVVLLGYLLGWLWMWASPGPWSFVTGVMMQTMWVVLATWAFARLVDKRPPATLGFRRTHALRDGIAGAALGFVLIGSIGVVEGRLAWAAYESVVLNAAGAMALLRAVILFVCVAISEETWFRGYQLSNLADACAAWGPQRARLFALLLSSFFFGCAHILNPHATVLSTTNIIVGGLLLGVTFARTRRLAFPIGLHFSWNLMQSLLDMPVSGQTLIDDVLVRRQERGDDLWTGGAFGPEAGLLGLLTMVVGALLGLGYARVVEGPIRSEVDTKQASCEPRADDERALDRPNLGGDSTAP